MGGRYEGRRHEGRWNEGSEEAREQAREEAREEARKEVREEEVLRAEVLRLEQGVVTNAVAEAVRVAQCLSVHTRGFTPLSETQMVRTHPRQK